MRGPRWRGSARPPLRDAAPPQSRAADDVVTTTQIGQRPGREDDVDRRARAGTEGQIAGQFGKPHDAWVTGRTRKRDGILDHSGVDVDRVDGGLQPPKSVRVEDRVDPLGRADHPLDDDVFLCGRGISDEHLEHEPVDLRLRERIGSLGLDGVLGGHDEERVRRGEGLAADRHLAFLHDLQQGALHLGRRPVDLVGEDEVGEDRAERHLEVAGLLVVDPGADEVGGDQVGRELDALEVHPDRLGERLDRHRLGQTGDALDEQVPTGQERDEHPLEELVLADDGPLHLVEHLLERVGAWPRRGGGGRGAGGKGSRHLAP